MIYLSECHETLALAVGFLAGFGVMLLIVLTAWLARRAEEPPPHKEPHGP